MTKRQMRWVKKHAKRLVRGLIENEFKELKTLSVQVIMGEVGKNIMFANGKITCENYHAAIAYLPTEVKKDKIKSIYPHIILLIDSYYNSSLKNRLFLREILRHELAHLATGLVEGDPEWEENIAKNHIAVSVDSAGLPCYNSIGD